jgi:hypothetical protein
VVLQRGYVLVDVKPDALQLRPGVFQANDAGLGVCRDLVDVSLDVVEPMLREP